MIAAIQDILWRWRHRELNRFINVGRIHFSRWQRTSHPKAIFGFSHQVFVSGRQRAVHCRFKKWSGCLTLGLVIYTIRSRTRNCNCVVSIFKTTNFSVFDFDSLSQLHWLVERGESSRFRVLARGPSVRMRLRLAIK